jgi:hypothetical protein
VNEQAEHQVFAYRGWLVLFHKPNVGAPNHPLILVHFAADFRRILNVADVVLKSQKEFCLHS